MAEPAKYTDPGVKSPRIAGVHVKPLKLIADERG